MWFLPLLNIFAILVVLAITIYGFFVHYIYIRAKTLMPELSCPDGYIPVFGHLLEFSSAANNSGVLRENMNYYGLYYKEGFYGVLGHQTWIFAVGHHMLQEVLGSMEATDKNYVYRGLDLVTDGVFIARGKKWRKLRKMLNSTFSVKQLDAFMDPINDKIKIFLDTNIKNLSLKNTFEDIQPYLARCYFDIVTMTHFGVHTTDQIDDESKVTEVASRVVEIIIGERFVRPHLHPTLTFQFTDFYKEIIKIRKQPLIFIESIIQKRLQYLEKHQNNDSDHLIFLDQLLVVLKELDITPNLFNLQRNSGDILIAGSDTTSIAAATALYHLALNKDMQEKVYQEVSMYCGQDYYKPLSRQDINSMTYLDMVMNEALRWCAPAGVARTLNHDFDAGSYVIPKRTSLYLLISPQHQNPDFYERPSEFYPEHFSPEAVRTRPKMAFIPFSSGPRNCPGKIFAYILVKAAVAAVVNKYYMETNLPLNKVNVKMILMSQHIEGYPIRFTPRRPTLDSS